ncbi:hypothetical protein KEJ15_00175 [Candidatus Bathyarchaeota archaeon]|nr:hypothetical protein [Candidatus Bathyarchaeota archaeon]
MTKNEIKLQYSGFVIFAARLVSVVTGFAFQLMIARQTLGLGLKTEYDMWFNINDITAYFTLLAGIIPFWSMRFMARGEEGAAKTGIAANLVISLIATLVYVPIVPLITTFLKIGEGYVILYYIVAAEIVEIYTINVFESCLRVKKAHVLGFGLMIAEACKLVLGYIFIIEFKQPLQGALISLIFAMALQAMYYLALLTKELRDKIKWSYVKEWLKGSVLNIYQVAGGQVAALIFIMLFSQGGEGGRSNYGVSSLIANVITYSAFLAFALTPKLLAERKPEDITTSLRTVLMFAVPMTTGVIALSQSYLTIMGTSYEGVVGYEQNVPILIVLALDALVLTIGTVFGYVLFGAETVDAKAKISFKELMKSRLFIAFSLPYLHFTITIPSTYYVLTSLAGEHPLQAAFYTSIINASARLVTFAIQLFIVRKMIKVEIPWNSIAKYVLASLVMGATLYILPRPTKIMPTLGMTALGGIIYFTILAVTDAEARYLIMMVLKKIKKPFSG